MPKSCNVADYMSVTLVTFSPEMEVLDAISQMIEHRISGAPVLDERGNIVGMLSEFDCLKVALQSGYYGDAGGRVSSFMVSEVKTVDAATSIIDVAQLFLSSKLRRFPVISDSQLVGQISRHDVLRALQDIANG